MKRIVILLSAVVMLFSFTACNNKQKENNNDIQSVSDYMGKLEGNITESHLDSETYNSVGEETNRKQSSAVNITADNWNNYFDVSEKAVWSKNAMGEYNDVTVYQTISLKEEYHSRLDYEKDFDVAFDVSAKCILVGFEFDCAKQEYRYRDDLIPGETPETTEETVHFCNYIIVNDSSGITKVDPLRVWSSGVGKREDNGEIINDIYKYYDIQIIGVSGTLFLFD